MKNPFKPLAFLTFLPTFCLLATSQTATCKAVVPDPAIERSLISAQYDQMNKAFAEGNIDGVRQMLAPGYTELDPNGKSLDRTGLIAKLSSERRQIVTIATQYTITNLAVNTTGLIVNMHTHASGIGAKKVLFMTLHGKFVNDMIVQDTWTDDTTGWHLIYRHTFFDQSKQSAS